MEKVKKILDQVLALICMALLAIITILVVYQVVVRYLFNSPNAYTEVLAKYGFVWMILYASAYVFGCREHMNIGFLRDKLGTRPRIILEMVSEFLTALFVVGVMLFGGYLQATRQMIQLDSALQIPMGIIYSAVPISTIFIIFYFIYNEYELFKELASQVNQSTGTTQGGKY